MKLNKKELENIKIAAKMITIHGYRNSPIEDIHAGKWPKNLKGEFADEKEIIITTKDGGTQIPWNECSRITDKEMKHLNKTIYNQIYSLMIMMQTKGLNPFYLAYGQDWDEPEILKWAE